MKYTKLTYECCIERTKCDIECEFLLFIQRPFIDHLRTENGIKTQRQIKKQSFQCIKEMAVFRCFECILYFFICFVISRSPVQVRPVAPRAEIISAFYFFSFSETHFKIQFAIKNLTPLRSEILFVYSFFRSRPSIDHL